MGQRLGGLWKRQIETHKITKQEATKFIAYMKIKWYLPICLNPQIFRSQFITFLIHQTMALKLPYLISFMLLLIFPFSATAQNYRSITLGSSLIANGNNSSWVSPSGDFAFGFQQIVSGGYLLAIWFDKIPEKTIVWSANGDSLAEEGSKIQLNTNGNFVLSDPKDRQIWAPSFARTGVAYASMLDTGNFVLVRNNSSFTLWQSFDEPTDTLLPTQVLIQPRFGKFYTSHIFWGFFYNFFSISHKFLGI